MCILRNSIEQLLDPIVHVQDEVLQPHRPVLPAYEDGVDWDATQDDGQADTNHLETEFVELILSCF